MSYKLYTDKNNKFQCSIQVEGTSLVNSKARIILEGNDVTYLFKGKIFENGVCDFDLPRLKNMFNEGSIGKLTLEVIADDVYFEPWTSDFIVEADKKVTVTLKEQDTSVNKKPQMVMSQITLEEKKPSPLSRELTKDQMRRLLNKRK